MQHLLHLGTARLNTLPLSLYCKGKHTRHACLSTSISHSRRIVHLTFFERSAKISCFCVPLNTMGHTGSIGAEHLSAAVLLCGFPTYSSPISAPTLRLKKRRKCGIKVQVGIRDGISFETVTSVYNEADFRGAFRMSRNTFSNLLDVVRLLCRETSIWAGVRNVRKYQLIFAWL